MVTKKKNGRLKQGCQDGPDNERDLCKGAGPEQGSIDYELVESLSETLATESEIAALLGRGAGALRRDPLFAAAYKKGQAAGKLALRRKQCQLAATNASMAVWLGKQYLGQNEKTVKEDKGGKGTVAFRLPKEIEELAE